MVVIIFITSLKICQAFETNTDAKNQNETKLVNVIV